MEVVVNPRSYKLAITGILIMLAAGCGGGTGASLSITSSVAPSPSSTISERPTPRLTATLTAAPSPLPPTPVPPTPPAQPVTLPPAGSPALVIRKGDASRKIVAFSFDAGADAGFAAQILDTLALDGMVGGRHHPALSGAGRAGRNLCFPCRVGIAGRAGASGDNRRPSRPGLFHRLRTGRAAALRSAKAQCRRSFEAAAAHSCARPSERGAKRRPGSGRRLARDGS